MPTVSVTRSDSGLILAEVKRTDRVSPHIIRVTLAGGDLGSFAYRGFDQWFRLALPVRTNDRLDNLPQRFGFGGLLKFLTLPKGTRPVIRNYTVRQFHEGTGELDIDFVVHGTEGVAGPWASTAQPGSPVALIDQGCGWSPLPAEKSLIVADESGMPAALGILRDMPREAVGDAIIEIFDERDKQDVEAPDGMDVRWVIRDPDAPPGSQALPTLRGLPLAESLYAFAVGESALATGTRRHLVNDRGIPKSNITFCGYWRVGKASPS